MMAAMLGPAASGSQTVNLLVQVQSDLAELNRIHDNLRSHTRHSHLYDQLIEINEKLSKAKTRIEENNKIAQELERDIELLLLRRENEHLKNQLAISSPIAPTEFATAVRPIPSPGGLPPAASQAADGLLTSTTRVSAPVTAQPNPSGPITQIELESVPISMRGGAKLGHVNELLLAIQTYFRKHPRKPALTLTDLVTLVGPKMAGRTGQCMINVLRSLGHIEFDVKRGVSLPGRSQTKTRP